MCVDSRVESMVRWKREDGGRGDPSHLVLLCRRPLAPALSGSSVDPWTYHLDFPTNHIKVSSLGIHQAKWILEPDRPDGEKAQGNPCLLWSDMIYPSSVLASSLNPSVPFITGRHWFDVRHRGKQRLFLFNQVHNKIIIPLIILVFEHPIQIVRHCDTLLGPKGIHPSMFTCAGLWPTVFCLQQILGDRW